MSSPSPLLVLLPHPLPDLDVDLTLRWVGYVASPPLNIRQSLRLSKVNLPKRPQHWEQNPLLESASPGSEDNPGIS